MKIKTSITLSEDVLRTVDELCGEGQNRSEFIENALKSFIAEQVRKQRYERELEILNRYADETNAETEDALLYQIEL
jgi:metal-responsive CopG/Arc/MetJ family transcriptional regulator